MRCSYVGILRYLRTHAARRNVAGRMQPVCMCAQAAMAATEPSCTILDRWRRAKGAAKHS